MSQRTRRPSPSPFSTRTVTALFLSASLTTTVGCPCQSVLLASAILRKSFVTDCSSFVVALATPTHSSTTPPPSSLNHIHVSCSTELSQTINLSRNAPLSFAGQTQLHSLPPPQCEVPVVPTVPGRVEEISGGNSTTNILPDVSVYDPLFLRWLHARRACVISQGYSDPLLVGPSFLARMFDRWLQQWWPQFHFLRVDLPGTNPSSWVEIFDIWFTTLSTEHASPLSPPRKTPTNASYTPVDRYQTPELANAGPASASLAGLDKRHYRNEVSTLTVREIQDACTVGGGDAGAIQCLAVVFPPGGVVTRSALKISKKSGVGHRGYQEFSDLVDDRWYCRLCGRIGSRTWKNEKDILNHVWIGHCDPRPLR